MNDAVNHPSHYTKGKIEAIDALSEVVKGMPGPEAALTWQVMKYMWRWFWKGKPLEDLNKAMFYLKRLIETVEKSFGTDESPSGFKRAQGERAITEETEDRLSKLIKEIMARDPRLSYNDALYMATELLDGK